MDRRISQARKALNDLKAAGSNLSGQEAESMLGDSISPLLEMRGYELTRAHRTRDHGVDFLAQRPPTSDFAAVTIGIELKHYRRTIAMDVVHQVIGAAMLNNLDRVVVVSSSGFSVATKKAVERSLPVQVELLGYDEIEAWVSALELLPADRSDTISAGIKALSRTFALEIAKDSSALSRLEWFDIERVIAEIFDGLGFKVTLTPPAKDGGKDVILEFTLRGKKVEYYVEVKHWRSATKVGPAAVKDFIKIVARERVVGGLFLSTHGYTSTAFEHLAEIDRDRVKFGGREKVLTLCKTYSKSRAGIWSPPECLSEILLEHVI